MNRGKEKPKPEVYRPPVMKYRKDIGKYQVKKVYNIVIMCRVNQKRE